MGLQSPVEVWKKDEIAALIALYETERCLYDENDKYYSDSEEKLEAYKRIHKIMLRIRPDCTLDEIKNRIKNFRRHYISEVFQRDVSVKAGLCTNDSYKPKVWYFEMLQFLEDYLSECVFSDASTVENSDAVEDESDEDEEIEENITRKKRKIESSSSSEREISNASSSSLKKYHSSTLEKKSHSNSSSVKKVHNTSVSQKKFHSTSSLQKKRLSVLSGKKSSISSSGKKLSVSSSGKKLHSSSSQKKVSSSLSSEKEPKKFPSSEKELNNSSSYEKEQRRSSSEKELKNSSPSEKVLRNSLSSEKEQINSSSSEKELKSSLSSEKESNSFSDLESKKECEKELPIVSSPSDIPDNVHALNSLDREDIFGQYVATELRSLRKNPLIYLQTKQSILESITSANFELLNPDS